MKEWLTNHWNKSTDSLVLWRVAICRVIIYGGIVAWGSFTTGEGFADLSDLTRLQTIKLYGNCGVAFGGVLLAFLDKTSADMAAKAKAAEVKP
jgi:hypothetical protein